MTHTVSGGTLNSPYSLTHSAYQKKNNPVPNYYHLIVLKPVNKAAFCREIWA